MVGSTCPGSGCKRAGIGDGIPPFTHDTTSGNVLEWFDITVYGFLAPTLGRLFFPFEDPFASLLSAFAVLAIGYAARPVGSVVYGHIGDRIGRKPALISSVILMGIGSVLIGMLPTHAEIGVTASILLVAIRVVQGISVAGEYTASGVLIVDEARQESRGLVGSWIACAMMLGCVLGSGVPALITSFLTDEQISAWGVARSVLFRRRGRTLQHRSAPSSIRIESAWRSR